MTQIWFPEPEWDVTDVEPLWWTLSRRRSSGRRHTTTVRGHDPWSWGRRRGRGCCSTRLLLLLPVVWCCVAAILLLGGVTRGCLGGACCQGEGPSRSRWRCMAVVGGSRRSGIGYSWRREQASGGRALIRRRGDGSSVWGHVSWRGRREVWVVTTESVGRLRIRIAWCSVVARLVIVCT